MSFHKRSYSQESIFKKSIYGFESFDVWIMNPDAHSYLDSFSNLYISLYVNSESDVRSFLWNILLCNDIEAIKSSLEAIKTIENPTLNDYKIATELNKIK